MATTALKTIDEALLARAGAAIRDGALVVMPTETVYGLAGDATNDAAVAAIFAAKGRPRFNPLIVHVENREMAACYVSLSPAATRLADAFWPGPLTIVAPRRDAASLLASAGLETLAVRAPAHPAARALIAAAGRPLAAPSANPSGAVSPTRESHIDRSIRDAAAFVLDGGPCDIGLESTIVKVDGEGAAILRPGGVSHEALEAVLGAPLAEAAPAETPEAPGMLKSHYAPHARVFVGRERPQADEAFLAFGPDAPDHPFALNLSEAGDTSEAAAHLFDYLRKLDALCAEKNLTAIAAAPVPDTGLGRAINDRLQRAAAPREQP
ncbi:MAG: L-threonylcarbamoyladenylate synthase [Pseudomonadota bacterium]